MLELVDRHDSGSCARLGVEVQVLFRAELIASFLRISGTMLWVISLGNCAMFGSSSRLALVWYLRSCDGSVDQFSASYLT